MSEKIKSLREQLGYSRQEMARQLGVSLNAYGKNEAGYSAPGFWAQHRLSTDYGISMDWFLFDRGPMYFKEKIKLAELEKEAANMKKELEELEKESAEKLRQNSVRELKPEMIELVDYMEHQPLFYHEMLAFFQRLKKENKELSVS